MIRRLYRLLGRLVAPFRLQRQQPYREPGRGSGPMVQLMERRLREIEERGGRPWER